MPWPKHLGGRYKSLDPRNIVASSSKTPQPQAPPVPQDFDEDIGSAVPIPLTQDTPATTDKIAIDKVAADIVEETVVAEDIGFMFEPAETSRKITTVGTWASASGYGDHSC